MHKEWIRRDKSPDPLAWEHEHVYKPYLRTRYIISNTLSILYIKNERITNI